MKPDEPPFNWGTEVVSVRLGRRVMSSSKDFSDLRGVQEERLHIEDPFDRSRNLRDVMTKNTERLLHEQMAWMDTMCRKAFLERSPTLSPFVQPELYPPGVLLPGLMPFFPMLLPPMDLLPDMAMEDDAIHGNTPFREKGRGGKGRGKKKGHDISTEDSGKKERG